MFSFSSPSYFWFLLTLAGPLILHLLNRQRLREHVFPATRFLHQAQLPQDGRRRLKDILLLLLRLAVLGSVVFLLAGLRWSSKPQEAPQRQDKTVVFLLDSSASMSAKGRIESAKSLFESTLNILDSCQAGAVVYADKVITALPPQPSTADFSTLLSSWNTTVLCGEPDDAIRKALDMLGSKGERQLVIISDFQRGDWSRKLSLVPPDIRINLLDVQDTPPVSNVGIVEVSCRALGQKRLQVISTVRNFSPTTQKREIHVLSPGNETQSQNLELPPRSVTRCAFVIENAEPDGQGMVKLSADDYACDDSFPFWTIGQPPLSMLLVTSALPASLEELYYTRKAFEAGASEGLSDFQLSQITIDQLSEIHLQDYQAVFLLDSADQIQDVDFKGFKSYIEEGGILFTTCGDNGNVGLRNFQRAGLPIAQSASIAGATAKNATLGIGGIGQDSPIWTLFGDRTDHDLFLFPLRKHHRLNCLPGTRALLTSLESKPLLVERLFGAGKVFCFAFSFTHSWGDFPLTNSFLPLLRELALSSVPADFGKRHYSCGDHLVDADGHDVDTSQPALLKIGALKVAITPSIRESMLERMNLDDVQQLLKSDKALTVPGSSRQSDSHSIDLKPYVAVLALLLTLSEILIANRIS